MTATLSSNGTLANLSDGTSTPVVLRPATLTRLLPEPARVRLLAAGGPPQPGLTVVRVATRNYTDRQLLVEGLSYWWVARCTGGVVRACAYLGDQQAERDYDMFLTSPSPAGAWTEQD